MRARVCVETFAYPDSINPWLIPNFLKDALESKNTRVKKHIDSYSSIETGGVSN